MGAGNKLDLAEENRQVSEDVSRQYAQENNCIFMETSAKTNHNVSNLFTTIAKKLPKAAPPPRHSGIVIDPDLMPGAKKKKVLLSIFLSLFLGGEQKLSTIIVHPCSFFFPF